jgi:outer membrane cobalamin receptor
LPCSAAKYNDRYTYQGGNPSLKAEKQHSVDLNMTYRWFTLIAYWHYFRDGFFQYIKPYADNELITKFSYRNVHSYQTAYIGMVLSPKFGIWQPMLSVGVKSRSSPSPTKASRDAIASPSAS